MKVRHHYIPILILLILAGCAKQTTPTGGEKDEIPPKLIRSNPPNRQTNFNKNEIELTFDELIQVNNAREQIIITPSIGKKFEAEARKKTVILKLNGELKENTTYTIMFRDAVQDLTERNPAENLKLAFSTGNLIDSLSISGTVSNLLEDKLLKNYTVALVPYHDTVNIFKHEAQWITITNDKGEYQLDNLKAGSYLLYAFDDKNKNLIVDSRSEAFAFKAQPIELDSSVTNINLKTIVLDQRDFKLISSRPIARYFNVRTTKGIADYKVTTSADTISISSFLEDAATLRIYNTFPQLDSLPVNFHFVDSTANTIDTLLYVKFDTRTTTKENFTTKVEYCEFIQNKSILKAEITASKPISKINIDSIYIQLDSVNRISFSDEELQLSEDKRKLIIAKTVPKETDFTSKPVTSARPVREKTEPRQEKSERPATIPYNTLILPKFTLISIESDSSAAIQSAIKTITPENSGVMIVEVNTAEAVIVQIVNRSFKVVQESYTKHTRFENLPPAEYYVRVILDKNENRKWDPGNFFEKTEPEPVLFFKSEKGAPLTNLKANWEVGTLLITP
ncbi:MAG: Ig-like domain-containing protein [Cyclobacteriaceae bacterium]|nr:Ig-like domain-containing protein [Cyclobacteriaceae bacterium]